MSGVPKRLSKVARELNVGISTIVEFLAGKGHEIEAKPNTKIDDDQYGILLAEYMPDKAAKEKSQELKKNRIVRKSISLESKQKDDDVQATETNDVEESEEQPEILIKDVSAKEEVEQHDVVEAAQPEVEREEQPKQEEAAPIVEETAVQQEVTPKVEEEKPPVVNEEPALETPSTEDNNVVAGEKEAPAPEVKSVEIQEERKEIEDGPTVLGKIDLDSMNLKTRPDKKPKPSPKPQAKAAEKKENKQKVKKEENSQPKPEQKQVEKPESSAPAQETSDSDDKAKAPEFIRAKVKKLDGPTVLGKIELPVAAPKKKKPVASSSDNRDTENNRKKKRKRITQKPAAASSQNNQGGNNQGKRPGAPTQKKNVGGPNNKKGNRPKKRIVKEQPSEVDIQKEIKETLARLSGGGKSKASKFRREKRQAIAQMREEELAKQEAEKKILKVTEFVTASELANMMSVSVNDIISACMTLGMMISINQRMDAETLSIIAEEFGYVVEFVSAEEEEEEEEIVDAPEDLKPRPPIITVMGHVDHGKTSLLDYIRKENVIAGEAGGITQHIGAYNVQIEDGREISFLDTPGHEAFTAMRARGAQVTDLAIIVIAADDSVMPQTKEAINHAQAAGVPMIFAFNKIDKPGANSDKIREELSVMDILVEDWGGKYQCQEISAKNGVGIDELLEKVLLEAEMLELQANPDRKATGTVIEASLDKGRGYTTTLLVQQGTLKVGDMIVAGSYYGKVKAMFNERGNTISEAGPSHPVQMLGFNGAPNAGDTFKEFEDEREAKTLAGKREQLQREQGIRAQKHMTLEEIGRRLALGDFQELNIIVKGDVDGSVEALSDSLIKLSTENIQVNVLHKSVGQISETDVLLASASDAIIVGFQVRPSISARRLAEKEQIDIRLYSVIYSAIEEIQEAMEGMLKPKLVEEIVCNIEVREAFKISKVGTVAGCYVLDGTVSRNTKIRLIREGVVIYTGALGSLKRFKDDVKEVKAGYECGLNIENYNDVKVGDIIEGYEEKEVKQTLK